MKYTTVAVAAVLAVFTCSSYAASFYVGGAVGQSDVEISGYDKAAGSQAFVGISLSQNFAGEFAYTYLGQFDLSGASNTYVEVDGFEVTAVGKLPVSDRISFFGEAGFYSWNVDAVLFGTNFGSDDGTDLTYGVGMDVGLTDALELLIEYQRYSNVSDADIDTLRAGLSYNF